MKKNKAIATAVALASSVSLILSGFANASALNPYNTFKEAVRNTLYVTNGTMEMKLTANINNELTEETYSTFQYDLASGTEYQRQYTPGDDKDWEHVYYSSPREYFSMSSYMIEDGIQYYYHDYYDPGDRDWLYNDYDNLFDATDEGMRLAFACMDALSGNLKNYMVENEAGGMKQIRMDVDETMVPEFAKAMMGLWVTLMNDEMERYGYDIGDDATEVEREIAAGNLEDIRFQEGSFEVIVNEDGVITAGVMYGEVHLVMGNGKRLPASLSVEYTLTDIGTTTPAVPDVSDTTRYVKQEDRAYRENPAEELMNRYFDIVYYNVRNGIEWNEFTDEELDALSDWFDRWDAFLEGKPIVADEEELVLEEEIEEEIEKEPDEDNQDENTALDGNEALDENAQEETPATDEGGETSSEAEDEGGQQSWPQEDHSAPNPQPE